ncbi:MAG: 50S ribosomal protein L31 [Patescibacteria group bacterium]
MKKEIHPQYHQNAKIICACGNSFNVGSTLPEIHVEICSMCHPFYTGKQKLLDSARRVEKFKERLSKKEAVSSVRKGKKAKKEKADSKKKSTKKSSEE